GGMRTGRHTSTLLAEAGRHHVGVLPLGIDAQLPTGKVRKGPRQGLAQLYTGLTGCCVPPDDLHRTWAVDEAAPHGFGRCFFSAPETQAPLLTLGASGLLQQLQFAGSERR